VKIPNGLLVWVVTKAEDGYFAIRTGLVKDEDESVRWHETVEHVADINDVKPLVPECANRFWDYEAFPVFAGAVMVWATEVLRPFLHTVGPGHEPYPEVDRERALRLDYARQIARELLEGGAP
jgi:hypothetical protein